MKIKSIRVTDRVIPMCDITVANAHTYSYNNVFVHNSTRAKGQALLRVGIDTGIYKEKSGQMALDKDTLDTLAKKYSTEVDEYLSKPEYYDELDKKSKGKNKRIPYEVIAWLIERSTLRKQLSSYTEKLSKVSSGFINYNLFLTQTARLSSGGSGNEYFMNLNYQNLTKPKPAIYRAIHKSHRIYDSELMEGCNEILDYKFREVRKNEYIIIKDKVTGEIVYEKNDDGSYKLDKKGNKIPKTEIGVMLDDEGSPVEDTMYLVESTKQELNIRSAITVPDKEDWLFCSMDFSMQEAKIITNFCKEPSWLEPILAGEDLHTAMAKKMFGEENYDKAARKKAKFCLGENSFVATKRGLVRPKNLSINDSLLNRYNEPEDFGMITEENQATVEILYSNGIVEEYKFDHELLIWKNNKTEWKAVSDLTENDQIIGTTKLPINVKNKDKIIDLLDYTEKNTKNNFFLNVNTKEFAYLIGLYLGDGTLDRRENKETNKLEINAFRIHYSKDITNIIETFVNYIGILNYSIKDCGKFNNELRIFSKYFANYISENFGCVDYKTIPDWVFTEWDNELLSYLLAGLIDSDGKCKNNSVSFCNSNLDMINKIALICMQLGIKTSLTQNKADITLEDGTRQYENIDGQPYKTAYELNFYDMQNVVLPIQLDYKKPKEKSKNHFGWNYDDSIKESLNESNKNSDNKIFYDNFKRNKYKQIPVKHLDCFDNLELKKEYQPLKILKKTYKTGKTYVIETEKHHEYFSSGVISHNCNFGLIYLGTWRSLQQTSKLPEQECKDLYNKFWSTMVTMKNWGNDLIYKTKFDNDGNVYSYFGRPRRLKYYLANPNEQLKSFGERSVISHLVQSTGADIMRIVLVQLYKQIFSNPDNLKEIQFSGCVHDEINTVIRKDCIYKWVPLVQKIMEVKMKDWPLGMQATFEFGNSYGCLFPFEWTLDSVFIPKKA